MTPSLTQLIQRLSDSDDSLIAMIDRLFGSCSSNLQSIFSDTSSPRCSRHSSAKTHQDKRSESSGSHSTATTEESLSIKSKPKDSSSKKMLRSKSAIDITSPISTKKKSRGESTLKRHRSISKVGNSTSLGLQRQNTEIIVNGIQHDDDEISAISAHTLNEMHRIELRQKQINAVITSKKELSPVNYQGKENAIMSVTSYISELSSESTNEFESIWKSKSFGSHGKSNADNSHSINRRDQKLNSSIYRDYRFHRRGTRGPFATIEENDSLYLDEQEI